MTISDVLAETFPSQCRTPGKVIGRLEKQLSAYSRHVKGKKYQIGEYLFVMKQLLLEDMITRLVDKSSSLEKDLAIRDGAQEGVLVAEYDPLGRLKLTSGRREHHADTAYSFNGTPVVIEWRTSDSNNISQYLFDGGLSKKRAALRSFVPEMEHIVFTFRDVYNELDRLDLVREEGVVVAPIYGDRDKMFCDLHKALKRDGFRVQTKKRNGNFRMIWDAA